MSLFVYLNEPVQSLLKQALAGEKYPIAKLISAFEDTRADSALKRKEILAGLEALPQTRQARVLGITGTPGAGKSTLVGVLARRLIERDSNLRVAVLAIDPSSQVSGGSILADRTRVNFPLHERRLFFRSQASDRELGGVSRNTYQVSRLLRHLFDLILIETVGIGQNEIEIQRVADYTALVLQPLAGDQIQFMKAGIMEIPDVFIINKCDEKRSARRTLHHLQNSLDFIRPGSKEDIKIFLTSATQDIGITELCEHFCQVLAAEIAPCLRFRQEAYFFEKWVRDEYGRRGLRHLRSLSASVEDFVKKRGFEDAQLDFQASLS